MHVEFAGGVSLMNFKSAGVPLAILLLICAVPWGDGALAQAYPTKPVRIIAASSAGGPPDLVARTIGQQLTVAFGQQVIVENRPGAGGTIGADRKSTRLNSSHLGISY